jgi:hypothetical protein
MSYVLVRGAGSDASAYQWVNAMTPPAAETAGQAQAERELDIRQGREPPAGSDVRTTQLQARRERLDVYRAEPRL